MAPNGSQWLPMAPNDSHRVSLLPNHYPKVKAEHDEYMARVRARRAKQAQRRYFGWEVYSHGS